MDTLIKAMSHKSSSHHSSPKQANKDSSQDDWSLQVGGHGANSQDEVSIGQSNNVANKTQPSKKKEDSQIPDRMKNFFSQLIEDTLDDEERLNNPELIRVRNNILILLLVLCAYGVFYLIGDFVDILLTAYIAGIAYQQMRDRFCKILMSIKTYRGHSQHFGIRVIKALLLCLVAFVLPRLNYMLSYPERITQFPSLNDYLGSIKKNNSLVVFIIQVLIACWIFYILLGTYLRKVGEKLRPTNVRLVRFIYAVLIITFTLAAILVIPSVMFREVSSVGYLIQKRIEEKLGCQLIAFKDQNNTMPYCSDKITSENEFIRQAVSEFQNQNETIQRCMVFAGDFQMNYLGDQIFFDYVEIACTWYTLLQKGANYIGLMGEPHDIQKSGITNMVSTGTNIFKTFFGNLASILAAFSNFIFNFTTFVTMFTLTIQFNTQKTSVVRQIFSENKQQLISSITNLIQATFFIVIEHFVVSIVLLEIFGFTSINLLISTLLSSMAFFPFFRPWFGILVVGMIRMIILGEYYISLSFVVLYYILSEKIYSNHYRKMEIHEIVTNMSVLFGIYRFGIAGIFYGPLIIILYKFVEKELLMKELSPNKNHRESDAPV